MSYSNIQTIQVVGAMHEGGVEHCTLELAAYLNSIGVKNHVASNGGKLVAELENMDVDHHQIPLHKRNPISVIINAFRLARIFKEHNIQLAHAQSRGPAWSTKLACMMTDTKMMTTFHGAHRIQNNLKRLYNSGMVRGERIIAVSQFMKEHILNNYAQYGITEDMVDVIPRGIDLTHFQRSNISDADIDALRNEHGATAQTFVMTIVGRITRLKGHDMLIDAINQLDTKQDWQLWIVGDHTQQNDFLQQLKTKVRNSPYAERIRFVGEQRNIPLYMAASNVAISASIRPESFGRTMIEAQAMGTPAVATAHGGSLETIKNDETGLLVDPQNPESMAKALRTLMENEEKYLKLRDNCTLWAQNNFSVAHTCAQEWNSYKKVLDI